MSTTYDIASDYTVDERGCWNWNGYVDRNGYGKAYDENLPRGRRVDWAHRVSFRRHKGEIPPRADIDHTCQNTRCINPDHLDAVSRLEHARRTVDRQGKGQVQKAAAQLKRAGMTYAEIADTLGYSSRTGAAGAVNAAIDKGLVDADAIPRVRHVTDADREDIRILRAFGIPQTELGAFYGLDSSQISRICSGKTNGHGGKTRD